MMRLGIDLGGMSAKLGIVENGVIIKRTTVPTRRDSDYEKILADLIDAATDLIGDLPIEGIGIGSPGLINTKSGTVHYSNNIRWSDKPLRDDLAMALKLPVSIVNDAKAAALGEAVFGAGKNFSRVAMLTLGTGVGGAFVKDGKLESSSLHDDASGIFGHLTLYPDGKPCNCGKNGCLEVYCSATAMNEKAVSILGENNTAKELFSAAREGDPDAKREIDTFAHDFAIGLSSLGNVLRPEIFVIGGGMSKDADLFLPYVNEVLKREVYGWDYAPVTAVQAILGNDAGIIGAAVLNAI